MLTAEQASIADAVLGRLAGPVARWREDQLRAIAALDVPASRVLVVQATGWGKSAVYWAATAIRRAAGAGPTLVVSPLLSLMRDQVAAAGTAGLSAAALTSANVEDWASIEADIHQDRLDVVLVSPERLANPGFGRRVLDGLAGRLGLLVIDEAHSVSDWGHDFRPDYRRVADVLRELHPDTPVLATTATANARVTEDLATQLGAAAVVLRGPLARASLDLAVVPELGPVERYAWVVEHLPRLPGSGIVYVLTQADATRLTAAIRQRYGDELPVAAYTGALDPADRVRLEDDLRANRVKALVATSALGMGYDKPDLGFVVHVGSPPTPVAYYQQVGRAGRAIDRAVVVLLPSPADTGVWDYFITSTLPDPAEVEWLLAALPADGGVLTAPALESETGLRRGRIELLLKQLAVERIVDRVEGGWVATGRRWRYDAAHAEQLVALRRREAQLMRDYADGRRCLMYVLQEALDDPSAGECGRCSVCRGRLPDDLAPAPSRDAVAAVRRVLRGTDTVLDPRRMWPGGAYGSRGRIPAGEQADEGRVLVVADAPEWAELRTGWAAAVPSAENPGTADLLEAAVATLARWSKSWAQRPELVAPLACGVPPGPADLAGSVAAYLAEVGRLPLADLGWAARDNADGLDGDRPDGGHDARTASPHGTAARPTGGDEAVVWRDRLVLTPDGAAAVAGKAVLLVADRTASGWPVTMAAAVLRRGGATSVLPLLVHRPPS